ncbi:hypothetical protein L0668_08105 [Paraglaciecola aquimarina]|uniref:Uncharacterized protein n=1 Tax=Paraglaciecola algarum TaxID=3050085 RepID=A0ABS9D577_9ALTE|nr:hypothetical protein [Paraglaciecola sp. G1-23]MCF2948065.1 hypothetical protein [Paraglaciecola sp. G1-23]
MKHDLNDNGHTSEEFSGGLFFKERRKAYYHGKYHKRMFSLLLVVTGFAILMAKQGV